MNTQRSSLTYVVITWRCIIRPCQFGIMLSVRVRVGFRFLSPIKNKFVGEIFLYNSAVPGFRKK